MADLGDVAEAGLGTYAYTKQQELIAKDPGYRSYVERQQKIGLYVLGGIAVVAAGVILFGKKSEPASPPKFTGERSYEMIFQKAMKSKNKQAVLNLAELFGNNGQSFYSKLLYQHAYSL